MYVKPKPFLLDFSQGDAVLATAPEASGSVSRRLDKRRAMGRWLALGQPMASSCSQGLSYRASQQWGNSGCQAMW